MLGWALTQAGVKIVDPKKKDLVAEDPLAFPAADAGKSAPPTPKVAPKKVAPPAVEEEEEQQEEVEGVEEAVAVAEEEEEPELSETVDKIKNDNNVVVFFCKYKTTSDR